MTNQTHTITDNLDDLLAVLPVSLRDAIAPGDRDSLLEIVLDLGRRPEARFEGRYEYLSESPISREDLDFVESKLGDFGDDNRAGLPATLHRISAMRNRRGVIIGLTLRVGRAVTGIVDILRDLIESGQSLLLMGRPGLGKTTLLREMARVLADEMGKRVVIVDTSNEIAGDGDVPHPAIGRARRMQVAKVAQQHDVMIEAVENHMPEVVVIDEIGRTEEALASRSIAERGVQLIATVHGNTLENLLANPTMSDLVGGIGAVTLGDEEARRRGSQKTVLERKAPPTFDIVAEMVARDSLAIRRPVGEVVDAILRGQSAPPETRRRDENGEIVIEAAPPLAALETNRFSSGSFSEEGQSGRSSRRGGRENSRHNSRAEPRRAKEKEYSLRELPHQRNDSNGQAEARSTPPTTHSQPNIDMARVRRVFPYGLSRSRLARAIKHLGLPLQIARRWQEADAVFLLGNENDFPDDATPLLQARESGLPLIDIHGSTYAEILERLNGLFHDVDGPSSPRELAMKEARDAAQRVLDQAEPADLRPQIKPIRRAQHLLAEKFHLRSYSVGREPNRRVRFLPRLAR